MNKFFFYYDSNSADSCVRHESECDGHEDNIIRLSVQLIRNIIKQLIINIIYNYEKIIVYFGFCMFPTVIIWTRKHLPRGGSALPDGM